MFVKNESHNQNDKVLLMVLREPLLLVVLCIALSTAGLEWDKDGDTGARHRWMLQQNISTIYLVSSCHLDVGFADSAVNIVNRYFDDFFPRAIMIANTLRKYGGKERLVFTTHTYLVSLYLDCPPNMGLHCPDDEAKGSFKDAVTRGDITWHAFPFNGEPEYLLRPLMVEAGFNLTHRLDDMFGRPRTVTMSQRDVPGMTSNIIPVMVKAGVKAVTVGVNSASMPPAVPSVFQWEHNATNTRVLAMWHPGGYGGTKGISLDSMVIVPGMSQALAFAIRNDNSGPPSILEVFKNYASLKELFPKATIIASGYDPFVLELMQHQDRLAVVSGEIGDTWIYGTASDPWKTQQFYSIIDTWERSVRWSPELYLDDVRIQNFSRLLIKNGEHTWGKDVKTYLGDWTNWDNEAFLAHINTAPYQDMIASWLEQRSWGIDYALEALADHPLLKDIELELEKLMFDGHVSTSGYKLESNPSVVYVLPVHGGTISIQFDVASGNIIMFTDSRVSNGSLASRGQPLAQIVYQTFNNKSYSAFLSEYLYTKTSWADKDLGKHGLNVSALQLMSPSIKTMWSNLNKASMEYHFLVQLTFNDSTVVSEYGAPQSLWLGVMINNNTQLNLTLYIVNKTATRLPESLSLYFDPAVKDDSRMFVTKLGSLVDVDSVVKNGSQHLHSSQAVTYTNPSNTKQIVFESLDTSVLCVGIPNPFPTPPSHPVENDGFAFNIFNNIWGTNYVMWYPYMEEDKSSKYRFTMKY